MTVKRFRLNFRRRKRSARVACAFLKRCERGAKGKGVSVF
jgi:hypothetical protein